MVHQLSREFFKLFQEDEQGPKYYFLRKLKEIKLLSNRMETVRELRKGDRKQGDKEGRPK